MGNPPFFPKIPVCSHFLTIDCITFDNTLFLQLPWLILPVGKFFLAKGRQERAGLSTLSYGDGLNLFFSQEEAGKG
jgi:hypothetical protein